MNQIVLIGRLTKDVDLRATQNGTSVGTTTIAVQRPYQKDKEQESDFINLVVWGKQAEVMAKYCNKGSKVGVNGRLQTRTYENEKGKHYITEVIVENIEFLGAKRSETVEDKQTVQETKKMDNANVFEQFGDIVEQEMDLPF